MKYTFKAQGFVPPRQSGNRRPKLMSAEQKFRTPVRKGERVAVIVWLSAREAAKKLSLSHDTINRRGIPWQDSPVPYRLRWKYLVLDEGAQPEKRYYEPDVEALLFAPAELPKASRPRMIPRFVGNQSP